MTMQQSYEVIGHGYATRRRPDPRIEAAIVAALGDARTVLNVGAGTGSYEPRDREVVAVEPSRVMLGQRPEGTPAVRGVAEALPFANNSFDAAMAVLTIHHWTDWRRGLAEMRRVSRGPVAVLTHDVDQAPAFWLMDYFPAIVEHDRVRMPPVADVCAALEGEAGPVEVPCDCTDGFLGAFWRDPARYLDPGARSAISAFALLPPEDLHRGLHHLAQDLRGGAWHERHGELLARDSLDVGYRLVVSRPR
ncbi:MAG: class I SAM-dependent methyltransferase [Dehalococcoidia bacterium]